MQTDWTQWMAQLGSELYNSPTAYQSLLPELADLQQYGREYRSSCKLNGEKRSRRDKTVIMEAAPLVLIEHGEPAQNLVTYLMDRDRTDFVTTAKRMAELVGMELPQGDGWQQEWKQKQQQKEMLATVQDYYRWNLTQAQNPPKGITDYLHSRFTQEQVIRMGLGYIPSRQQLAEYLRSKGYEAGQVDEFIGTMGDAIGTTHSITIPIYRAGNVYSFIYRHHNQAGTGKDKYKYHTGVVLKDMLQYIPSKLKEPELVVVEGQLDCIHLLEQGIKNVVSTGTNHISTEQVTDAIQRGCRSFTLLYDADPTDKDPDKNHKHRTAAADTITETAKQMGLAGEVRVYIAELPQPDPTQKTDPSDYITENGVKAVQQLIDNAQKSWQYELVNFVNKYQGQQLTPKQQDSFNAGVLDIYDKITDHIGREQYKDYVAGLIHLNNPDGTARDIDPKAIEQMLAEHRSKKVKEKAQKEAKELMLEAGRLYGEGNIAKADGLKAKADTVLEDARAEQEYEQIKKPTSKKAIFDAIRNAPDAIHTGLHLGKAIDDNELLIPSGSLTVIAAPTSHGKTSLLVALAVNEARKHQDKEYYILHYEDTEGMMATRAANSYAGVRISDRNEQTILNRIKQGGWGGYYTDNMPDVIAEYDRKESEFYKLMEQGTLHIKHTEMCCESLCSTIGRLAAPGKLGGVFIDYIQRIPLQDTKGVNRRDEEIARICQMLEAVAAETGTPIVITSQYNREVTDPTKMHPTKMAEGASIERIAANIWGLWNTDMQVLAPDSVKDLQTYYQGLKVNPDLKDSQNRNNAAIIMVHKNRHGIGAAANAWGLLRFDLNTGKVGNYTQQRAANDNTDLFEINTH